MTLVVRRGQARQDEAKPHQYFCKGPNASRGHQQKHAPLHFKNFKPQVFLSHLHEQVGHSISFLTGFDGWWQAGYSSVGRASDCRVCRDQMVPGSIPGGRICLLPCKHEKSKQMLRRLMPTSKHEPPAGFEPTTSHLLSGCSTN